MSTADSAPASRGALAGLLAGAVAIGLGELVAGLAGVRSPVVAVGDGVIGVVPPAISEFAIDALGGLNRPALMAGVLIVLALFSLGLGVLATFSRWLGMAGVMVLGAVGSTASVASPQDALPQALAPALAATVGGLAALWLALGAAQPAGTASSSAAPVSDGRRAFLRTSATLAVVAFGTAVTGRWLQGLGSVVRERAETTLPRPDVASGPVPEGVDLGIDGLSPFITPNDDFYRIDTAIQVPRVDIDTWTLRVMGLVDNELELTYEDLLNRELVEADITLTCVSNEVGGDLIGNARWLGVRLDEILAEAGVSPEATQLVGRSVDGYTGGFPVADATDGRDALIAIGMNGEPLPLEHGYPVRLVTPGLYGYVSATKWLAELELTTFEAFDQYWVRRDWAEEAPVKTQSRIDTPRGLQEELTPGEVVVAGVAWSQGRGVETVEVQIDDGEWEEAELAETPNDDTWRQWRTTFDAEPGTHQIRVRATDGAGDTQGEERVDPIPDGAEGWHTIAVRVGERQG